MDANEKQVKDFVCAVCREVLYKNGEHMELPIVCKCGKSRIDLDDTGKGLKYTNIMTEVDGKIYEIN